MDKIISKALISLLLVFVVVTVIPLSGCGKMVNGLKNLFNIEDEYPEYESGDWRYAVKIDKENNKIGYIVGFSEEGKQKECVVLPARLDGVAIVGIGYQINTGIVASRRVGEFKSDKVKRIYVSATNIREVTRAYFYLSDCVEIVWGIQKGSVDMVESNSAFFYGYNLYTFITKDDGYQSSKYIANVTYMYNYDNAPNGGYYWADNYVNDLIKYIPPEPMREGYTFGGWYKDKECTEKWNFENDKTGDNIIVDSPYASDFEYIGTYLYAKWRKN